MKVKDLMTPDPAYCTPDTNLQEVAQLMVDYDCGCLPVVEREDRRKPVGVITDRDICCRTVAPGKNPLDLTAEVVMSSPVVTVTPETSMTECCGLMEEKQVRRVIVVDKNGVCCGILTQADIARQRNKQQTAEVVGEVSQPSAMPVQAW